VIHRDSVPSPAVGVQISIKVVGIQAAWGGKASIPLLLKVCHYAEGIHDLFSQKDLTRVNLML